MRIRLKKFEAYKDLLFVAETQCSKDNVGGSPTLKLNLLGCLLALLRHKKLCLDEGVLL